MAREKTTIPATLDELIADIADSRSQYTDHLAQANGAIKEGNYTKAKESLDKAHAEVLALKDLHNGVYRFLPKSQGNGKEPGSKREHAAITMAKEQASKDAAKQGKDEKSEKSAPAKAEKPKGKPAAKTSKAKGGSSLDP